jgi:hypothetical protein
MKCRLVKISELSGNNASIYSVFIISDNKTILDKFIVKYSISYKCEIIDILTRLKTIGKKTGARENFFKLNEGKPGDGVCALFDEPVKNLRVYCIRYGSITLIVGGGGVKPKSIKAFQEDPVLKYENELMRKLSEKITARLKAGDINFSENGMDFEGDFEFNL